jgi:hypothetical protein
MRLNNYSLLVTYLKDACQVYFMSVVLIFSSYQGCEDKKKSPPLAISRDGGLIL